MRYFLIYNPRSRQGRSRKDFERIIAILRKKDVDFSFVETTKKDEAISFARSAEADIVVAVGGDGTICEVITGLMSRRKKPKLGVIHIGTSPDFNRFHGIPIAIDEAIDVLLRQESKKIDVGKIEHLDVQYKKVISYFGSSVNLGLGPDIARRSNGRYRRFLGDLPGTLLATLVSLSRYKKDSYSIKIDGKESMIKDAINITIGKDPYIASGMRIPITMKQDGKMYLLSITGKGRLLFDLWRLYLGNILDSKSASIAYCTRVDIDTKGKPLEFDGDFRGYSPASISILKKGLEVIM